jgi:glucokinase
MQKVIISIDLGGTKCAGAVIKENGEIQDKITERIAGLKGNEVSREIYSMIDALITKVAPAKQVSGLGISVPGISYQEDGTVWAPNIPGWDNYPLMKDLHDQLKSSLPIHIDSDRACSICGEAWTGVAKGQKNAIFLAFGTGIGAGILIDGKVLRGNNDIAGSIGWMALDQHYPEGYREFGCFEYNASGDGLARLTRDIFNQGRYETSLDLGKIRAEDIFQAYEQRDPLALDTINNAIDYWAKAVANLVSIFNPEIIIFGGGVFGPGLKFLDRIYERSKKWAQPIAINQVKFVGGHLGNDAQLLGAARLVLDDIKQSIL